jgi:hypothetical protein
VATTLGPWMAQPKSVTWKSASVISSGG